MPVKASQMRRTSTDSDRSLTPSQIQMYVQVGTRWDKCTPLLEAGNVTGDPLYRNGSSYSCPNLAPSTRKNSIISARKPSDVATLALYRSSPLSAGAAFPLRWSTNFSYQGDRRASLGPNQDRGESRRLSAPCRGTPDCSSASPPTDTPFEHHMSKRDSRKMQDLEITPSAKGVSFLKVPAQSSTSSPHGSLSPVSPKTFFHLHESSHQQLSENPTEVILNLDTLADHLAKLEENEQDIKSRFQTFQDGAKTTQIPQNSSWFQQPGQKLADVTRIPVGTCTDANSCLGEENDVFASDVHTDVESIDSGGEDDDVDSRRLKRGYERHTKSALTDNEKDTGRQNSRHSNKNSAVPQAFRKERECQDGSQTGSLESRKNSSVAHPKSRHFSDAQITNVERSCLFLDGNICQVIDGLFLGNIKAAYCEPLLCKLDIECVVDLSDVMPAQVPSASKSICPCTCPLETAHLRTRLCINIPNSEEIDIMQYADDINRFIEGSLNQGKNVLIHSFHGKSRAPAVIIQYLMTMYKMSFSRAFSLVKSAFPEVSLNGGFHKNLQRLDRRLSAGSSNSLNLSGTPKSRSAWN
ncbi:uncharacterized protein LOC135205241 [Macrobrachium nipponense]|uniref:uncharacterized protein LOC135205241 n=1 Tax=Macrobrachium nipponense TaxID=159736 RepID=UPI0030C8141A